MIHTLIVLFFFFKQKTAYEMRISDWSSDVCSSDLLLVSWVRPAPLPHPAPAATAIAADQIRSGHSPAACAGTTDRTPCCARTRASAPARARPPFPETPAPVP